MRTRILSKLMSTFSLSIVVIVAGCAKSGDSATGSGTTLTTAGKVTTGIGNSVTAFKSLGGAIGGGSVRRGIHTLNAATKCTEHAEPGEDNAPADGTVSDGERISQASNDFALQKFYCTMAADSTGPESISGAVNTVKMVVCTLEKNLGSLTFDTTATVTPITSLTFTTECATQHFLDEMGAAGASSVTVAATGNVTTQANPNFTEVATNTHYTHGIKLEATLAGQTTKFIALAKFDTSFTGDPIQSGDFEFLTYGTGMQGTAIEVTAGKIVRSSSTAGHIWYESRINRQKTSVGDAVCPNNSSSCGFARHERLSADITFSGGDISNVSNFTGILSDSNDDTGSGGSGKQSHFVSASGSLATGLTGKIWQLPGSSAIDDMTGATTLADMTAGTTTCIIGSGTSITTTCGASAAVLAPAGAIKTFFLPPNTSTWFTNIVSHGGIGFTGAATLADEQFAL